MSASPYTRDNQDPNSYWDAMNSSQAGLNSFQETQALQDQANQPGAPADPGADPSAIGLANASARAQIMRQYADDQGADKVMANASSLGLQQAQTANAQTVGATNLLGLHRRQAADASSQQAAGIVAQITSQLQGLKNPDGTPRQPTNDELLQNQQQVAAALQNQGFIDQANAVTKSMAEAVKARVGADTDQRKADGSAALGQLQLGNFAPAIDFTKKYSYGNPSGISNIQPGQTPGTYQVTMNLGGKPVTSVVPKDVLTKSLQAGIGQMISKDASTYILNQAHLTAQTNQANASAAASSARANADNTATSRDTQVWNARVQAATPGAQPTPASQALVQAANDAAQAKLATPGSAKTPWLVTTDAQSGNQMMVNRATGETFSRDPKGNQWVSNGIPGSKPAPPAAGPAQPRSKAEYDQLPKGAVYIAPNGQRLIKG